MVRIGILVVVAALAVACGGSGLAGPSGSAGSSPAPAVAPSPRGSPAPTPVDAEAPTQAPDADPAVVITCDRQHASASAPAVRALRDGVHLEAVRPDGSAAPVDIETAEAGWIASMEGIASLVLAPGRYQVICLGASGEDGAKANVLVTDPDGLWRSGDVECEGGGGTTSSGDSPPALPEVAIDHLRSIVQSFRPDDVLEAAGYPDAPSGWIRLVRDGRLVASWFIVGAGDSVAVGSTRYCPDADITYDPSG